MSGKYTIRKALQRYLNASESGEEGHGCEDCVVWHEHALAALDALDDVAEARRVLVEAGHVVLDPGRVEQLETALRYVLEGMCGHISDECFERISAVLAAGTGETSK